VSQKKGQRTARAFFFLNIEARLSLEFLCCTASFWLQ